MKLNAVSNFTACKPRDAFTCINPINTVLQPGSYLRGGFTGSTAPPPKCSSQKFSTLFQYISSLQLQYCIFFSPKAFYDTQTMTKRRLWPGIRPRPAWGSSWRSPDPLLGWGGGHPPPTPSTPLSSQYQRLWSLISVNPSKIFSAYDPDYSNLL